MRPPATSATAVTTEWLRPESAASMRRASAASAGLPKTVPSRKTSVSAARTGRSVERAASRAFVRASRRAAATAFSPGSRSSGIPEGATRKRIPSAVRISARRGDAEARRSRASGSEASKRAAELLDALVGFRGGQIEGGPHPDRLEPRGERHQAFRQAGLERLSAKLRARQVEREEQPLSPDVRDEVRHLLGERLELDEEVFADRARVVDEVLGGDDLEIPGRAEHVDEVAAPGGVDARRYLEDRVDVVDPRVDRDPANLRLLPEDED